MSNKNYARRTVVKLYFKGADISKELSKYLLSLSFTDKEEDETDDISLSLDDREGKGRTGIYILYGSRTDSKQGCKHL